MSLHSGRGGDDRNFTPHSPFVTATPLQEANLLSHSDILQATSDRVHKLKEPIHINALVAYEFLEESQGEWRWSIGQVKEFTSHTVTIQKWRSEHGSNADLVEALRRDQLVKTKLLKETSQSIFAIRAELGSVRTKNESEMARVRSELEERQKPLSVADDSVWTAVLRAAGAGKATSRGLQLLITTIVRLVEQRSIVQPLGWLEVQRAAQHPSFLDRLYRYDVWYDMSTEQFEYTKALLQDQDDLEELTYQRAIRDIAPNAEARAYMEGLYRWLHAQVQAFTTYLECASTQEYANNLQQQLFDAVQNLKELNRKMAEIKEQMAVYANGGAGINAKSGSATVSHTFVPTQGIFATLLRSSVIQVLREKSTEVAVIGKEDVQEILQRASHHRPNLHGVVAEMLQSNAGNPAAEANTKEMEEEMENMKRHNEELQAENEALREEDDALRSEVKQLRSRPREDPAKEEELNRLQDENRKLRDDLRDVKKEKEREEEEAEAMEKENKKLRDDLRETKKEKDEKEEEAEKLEKENKKLRDDLREAKKEKEREEEEAEAMEKENKKLRDEAREAAKEKEHAEEEIEKLEKENKKLREDLREAKKDSDLGDEVEKLEKENKKLRDEAREAKKEKEHAEEEIEKLEKENKKLREAEKEKPRSESKPNDEEVNKLKDENKKLRDQLREAEKDKPRRDNKRSDDELKKLKDDNKKLQDQLRDAEREKRRLEREKPKGGSGSGDEDRQKKKLEKELEKVKEENEDLRDEVRELKKKASGSSAASSRSSLSPLEKLELQEKCARMKIESSMAHRWAKLIAFDRDVILSLGERQTQELLDELDLLSSDYTDSLEKLEELIGFIEEARGSEKRLRQRLVGTEEELFHLQRTQDNSKNNNNNNARGARRSGYENGMRSSRSASMSSSVAPSYNGGLSPAATAENARLKEKLRDLKRENQELLSIVQNIPTDYRQGGGGGGGTSRRSAGGRSASSSVAAGRGGGGGGYAEDDDAFKEVFFRMRGEMEQMKREREALQDELAEREREIDMLNQRAMDQMSELNRRIEAGQRSATHMRGMLRDIVEMRRRRGRGASSVAYSVGSASYHNGYY